MTVTTLACGVLLLALLPTSGAFASSAANRQTTGTVTKQSWQKVLRNALSFTSTPSSSSTTTTSNTGSGIGSSSIAAPVPPSSYSIPAGAAVVSSSSQLVSALAAGTPAIVLADGTYGVSAGFDDSSSSSLYAQHLGDAVLTTGLTVGGNFGSGGAVIEGLAFNVTNPSTTFQNSEVNIWGASGERTHVLDCTFSGNWAIGVGLDAVNPNGLVAQRLTFADFTDGGLRASDNAHASYGGSTAVINSITDISVNGVSKSTPGASDGTAEAGIWVGEPISNGVHRILIKNVSNAGIETVNNSWNTTFSDLNINMSGPHAASGVGVYMEHSTTHDTFTNFVITGTATGFNAEWDDGIAGNAAAHSDTIENGTIDASGWTRTGNTAGVYLDAGTGPMTVTNVAFKNQNWAGIGAYRNIGPNSFSGNTYQLATGAVQMSANHV